MCFHVISTRIWRWVSAHPLFSIVMFGVILRLPFIFLSAVHGDEGMYLYDSRLILEGATPFEDFHTRAPVFLYSLAAFMFVSGVGIISARFFSLILFIATAILIFQIGNQLKSRKTGLFSAMVFSLSPFGIVWSIVVETEICLVFFLSLSMLLLIRGVGIHKSHNMKKNVTPGISYSLLFLSGLILALAVFSRRTAVIIFPASLLFLHLQRGRQNFRTPHHTTMHWLDRRILFFSLGFILLFIFLSTTIILITDVNYFVSTFLSSAGVGSTYANRIKVLRGLVVHGWYIIFPLFIYLHLQVRIRFQDELKPYLDVFTFLVLSFIIVLYTFITYIFLIPLLGYFLYIILMEKVNEKASDNTETRKYSLIISLIVLSVFSISKITEELFYYSLIIIIILTVIIFFYLLYGQGRGHITGKRNVLTLSSKGKWSVFIIFTLLISVMAALNNIFLTYVFSVLLLLSALLFSLCIRGFEHGIHQDNDTKPHPYPRENAILLPALWFVFVSIFYSTYNMLGEIYLYELLPPISLIVGLFINSLFEIHPSLYKRILELRFRGENMRSLTVSLIVLFIFSATVSGAVYFNEEIFYSPPGRTDDFTKIPGPKTVEEVGEYIKKHTLSDQEILTANMAIAVEAHRNIVMNLSHPSVYSSVYEKGFAPLDTINYPTLSELMEYMNRTITKYVIYDVFLNQYYLKFNPQFRDYIISNYHIEKQIDNVYIYVRSNYNQLNRLSLTTKPAADEKIATSVFPEVTPGVVWEEKENGKNEIYYGWLNVSGRDFSGIKLTPPRSSKSYSVQAAMDSKGRMHVVWEESFGDYSILDYAVVQGGHRWIFPLMERRGNGIFARMPVVGVDHDDAVHIVWTDNRGGNFALYYMRLDSNGIVRINATELVNAPGDIRNPTLSIDDENYIHLAFEDGRNGRYQIYYMVLNGTADAEESSLIYRSPVQVSQDYRAVEPDIFVDHDRKEHIVFKAYSEEGREYIHYSCLMNGAFLWERNVTESKDNVWRKGDNYYSHVGKPVISKIDGYIAVAYEKKGMSYNSRIELSIFQDNEKICLSDEKITCSMENYISLSPDMAYHNGNLTLLYVGRQGTQSTIFLEELSPFLSKIM